MSSGQLSADGEGVVTWGQHETYHGGISQFRVGSFDAGIGETTHDVTFAQPMPDDTFEVFLQAKGNVTAHYWVTNISATGFTANFSAGNNTAFSYFAVGQV